MYLFHLISIDLELSRSFNPTLQSLHTRMSAFLRDLSLLVYGNAAKFQNKIMPGVVVSRRI